MALASSGSAFAANPMLEVESSEPVALRGDAVLGLRGGAARVLDEHASGDYELRVAEGELVVRVQQRHEAQAGDVRYVDRNQPVESRVFSLRNATLMIALDDEPFSARVAAPDALLRVRGDVDALGVPARLLRDVEQGIGLGEQDDVPIHWRQGWWLLGDGYGSPDLAGFPTVASGILDVDGSVRMSFQGGNLSFTDADGRDVRVRLGRWSDPASPATSLDGLVDEKTWSWAVLDGRVTGSAIPLGARWVVAGPEASWEVDGETTWTRASGHGRRADGEPFSFHDATVAVEGLVRIAPSMTLATATSTHPAEYLGTGEWRRLSIDGQTIDAPAPTTSPVLAVATGAALFAIALAFATETGRELVSRAAVALYSRLAPGELLDHPTRRAIVDAAHAEPGVHLRELHRRVGGAWGPFLFHVRMLERGGHVRVAREGRYATVVPTGMVVDETFAVRHPLAQRVLAELPADGAPLDVARLRERLGVSRQLMDYHVRALAERGLIDVTRQPLRKKRFVRRASARELTQRPA